MRIKIILRWCPEEYEEGLRPGDLIKYVEMPALPPSGIPLFIDLPGEFEAETPHVEMVSWVESEPDTFEVDTDIIEVECTEEKFVEEMEKLGWSRKYS